MRKTKAKATAKVDALLAEPFTNDEEFMQRIVDRAQAESMRRMDEQPVKTKKKGLWRGAPALCALVIILLVAPILAVIVNPVSFSKANQLVRKATIWVNDTFKLGIELPVEDEESKLHELKGTKIFLTETEAIEYVETNILILDEKCGCGLKTVEVTKYDDILQITSVYDYKGESVRLCMESIFHRSAESPVKNAEEIESPAGKLWMWSLNGIQRASGYIDDWSVDIRTTIDSQSARFLFESLKWFN